MALEELLAALESESASNAEHARAAALLEAERIAAEASARCSARRASGLRAEEERLRARLDATLAQARRRVRAEVLEQRRIMLDRVFAAATAIFPCLTESAEFECALHQHLEEAKRFIEDTASSPNCKPRVLRCRPELERVARPLAERNGLTLQMVPGDAWGLRLIDVDTGLEVDNTLEARLERLRLDLAVEITRAVEGDADGMG
jgi:vacuolar-type H+-ATPase subunit E/Vma4